MKKNKVVQIIFMFGYMLAGAVCGVILGKNIKFFLRNANLSECIIGLLTAFLMIYLIFYLHIILHEAGHLLFGCLTGYRFLSFRIGSLMWVRGEDNKIHRKKFSLAGTGGQCLMSPPELVEGKLPVVLYNLGGSILNLLFSVVCLVLYFIWNGNDFVSAFLILTAVIGIFLGGVNGIPLHFGVVDNDGCNALSLRKNEKAMRAFYIQLKANELLTQGVRIRDMPEEWFVQPSDEEMKNSMQAVIGIFVCNRFMEQQRFEEAKQLMKHFFEIETSIVGLHHNLLVCEYIFCELIGENNREVIEEKYDIQQKKFMKAMKNYPTVIRTEYALSLFYRKEREEAEKWKEKFEKISAVYPYSADMEAEREMLEKAEEIFLSNPSK